MPTWHKSSYREDAIGRVEIGRGVGIRDSEAPTTRLPVSVEARSAFLDLVRVGRSAHRSAPAV